jgi:hypothetical protein
MMLEYDKLLPIYVSDFWAAFQDVQLYKMVSGDTFSQLLTASGKQVECILRQKKIVQYYPQEIRSFLLQYEYAAEILLQDDTKNMSYLSDILSADDSNCIFKKYLELPSPNLNVIKKIYYSTVPQWIPKGIDAHICLLAKKRMQSIEAAIIKGNGISIETVVGIFRDSSRDIYHKKVENDQIQFSYNQCWLEENLDYPTILNNFIYLFEYVDRRGQSTFPAYRNDASVFERCTASQETRIYPDLSGFLIKNQLHLAEMKVYIEFLKGKNIYIEDVLEWFFQDYLKDEFGVDGFIFRAPSRENRNEEKCQYLLMEIEAVLKQFNLYTQEGKIDHELISLSSKSTPLSDIGSLIHRKYMYPRNDNTVAIKAMNILSSEQSPYMYVHNSYDEEISSFYDLLLSKEVRRSDYDDYPPYQQDIDLLIENHVLYRDVNERLKPDPDMANILFYLYQYDSVCLYYLFYDRERLLNAKSKYELDKYFVSEEKLLTKKEAEYLNYILNKSEFSNGLDLRNKYMHGSFQRDEKQAENDYLIALEIAVMIAIKINEEFRLRIRFSE